MNERHLNLYMKKMVIILATGATFLSCSQKNKNRLEVGKNSSSNNEAVTPEIIAEARKRLEALKDLNELPESDRKMAFAQLIEDSLQDSEIAEAASAEMLDESDSEVSPSMYSVSGE